MIDIYHEPTVEETERNSFRQREYCEGLVFGRLKPLYKSLILGFDFDGTITLNDNPLEEPVPDMEMINIINEMQQFHNIIIWTCRAGKDLENMIEFLDQYDVKFDLANTPYPEKYYDNPSRKIWCHLYIDNAARFDDEWDYKKIRNRILELEHNILYIQMVRKLNKNN